jgi:hypothetical protein
VSYVKVGLECPFEATEGWAREAADDGLVVNVGVNGFCSYLVGTETKLLLYGEFPFACSDTTSLTYNFITCPL